MLLALHPRDSFNFPCSFCCNRRIVVWPGCSKLGLPLVTTAFVQPKLSFKRESFKVLLGSVRRDRRDGLTINGDLKK